MAFPSVSDLNATTPTFGNDQGTCLARTPNSFASDSPMQIIPAIDLRGGKCVRLQQGDYNRETVFGEDPVEIARSWVGAGAERLHLVDLDGARTGRPVNHEVVADIVRAAGVPCQLGGGVRTEETIRLMIEQIGLERVIIGTKALRQPEWFREMVEKFPGRLLLSLDVSESKVATEGWLDVSETSGLELGRQFVQLDLPAVIYTNIANDGMMQGVDEATIGEIIELTKVGLRVIASGGVSTMDDVCRLKRVSRKHPNLVGAIVGRAIYEGTLDLAEAIRVAREDLP